jgi:hypothetical protein
MATLEMVPLRSKMPNTGRMTLRYPLPTIATGGAVDMVDRPGRTQETITTPQVASAPSGDGETTARKGGEAR